MIKQKLIIIIIGIIFTVTFSTFGQSSLARIIDEDGYTYLRNGQSINSQVIDTIYKNELFYCVQSNSDWYEVTEVKWNKTGYSLTGFMHKSRIQIIDSMIINDKKKLIEKTFERYKELGNELNNFVIKQTYNFENKTWNSKKDSLDFEGISKKHSDYSENYFSPILESFSIYFCETKDIETIDLFINTLWANKGSANEIPSYTFGECFICEPELIKRKLISIENTNKLDIMINHIHWGLMNLFWTEEDGDNEPSSQEYLNLIKQLESLKE